MNARVMLTGITAIAFLAVGCNQKGEGEAVSGVAATPGPAALAGHSPEQATTAETATGLESAEVGGAVRQESVAATLAESMPPEIDASVSEDPVAPGSVIEITAVGSSDVTEMVLRDALGRTYPLTRHEETGTWRAFYRIPMKVAGDRVGLSITARNGVNRWRRVWVFPKVATQEAASDSSRG